MYTLVATLHYLHYFLPDQDTTSKVLIDQPELEPSVIISQVPVLLLEQASISTEAANNLESRQC